MRNCVKYRIEKVIKVLQSKFNDYLRTQIDYKPYLEHI